MTATDELRKLLDERGVEWREDVWKPDRITEWDSRYGTVCAATSWETMGHEWIHLCFYSLTPEEVLAATLGSGTCEYAIKDNMNETEGMGDVWIECSACHCAFDYYADEWLMNMHYCPNCGAKVVKQ